MNKLKVIDLFAGCGGLSLGFRKAGFKVPIHLEINENFCKTLEENSLPEEIVINEDITIILLEKFIFSFNETSKTLFLKI